MLKIIIFAAINLVSIGAANSQILPDSVPTKDCWNCEAWNKPHSPFQVFGNAYYVGTAGLSAVLIATPSGHILLDGALSQSAPLIDKNIRSLGFDTKDIKYIANSHAHYDHAGGIAALQKETGAYVISSEAGIKALAAGGPLSDDPQFAYGSAKNSFPPIENLKVVNDRGEIKLGDVVLTAHHTPGHTPGGVTWAWRSCADGHCMNMVYADSLTPVAADGYRFTEPHIGHSSADSLKESIEHVASLPCDIMISTHPEFSGILNQYENYRKTGDHKVFVDENTCRSYAKKSLIMVNKRIVQENGEKGGPS